MLELSCMMNLYSEQAHMYIILLFNLMCELILKFWFITIARFKISFITIKAVYKFYVTYCCSCYGFLSSILNTSLLRATLWECYSRVWSILQLPYHPLLDWGRILQLPQLVWRPCLVSTWTYHWRHHLPRYSEVLLRENVTCTVVSR